MNTYRVMRYAWQPDGQEYKVEAEYFNISFSGCLQFWNNGIITKAFKQWDSASLWDAEEEVVSKLERDPK